MSLQLFLLVLLLDKIQRLHFFRDNTERPLLQLKSFLNTGTGTSLLCKRRLSQNRRTKRNFNPPKQNLVREELDKTSTQQKYNKHFYHVNVSPPKRPAFSRTNGARSDKSKATTFHTVITALSFQPQAPATGRGSLCDIHAQTGARRNFHSSEMGTLWLLEISVQTSTLCQRKGRSLHCVITPCHRQCSRGDSKGGLKAVELKGALSPGVGVQNVWVYRYTGVGDTLSALPTWDWGGGAKTAMKTKTRASWFILERTIISVVTLDMS